MDFNDIIRLSKTKENLKKVEVQTTKNVNFKNGREVQKKEVRTTSIITFYPKG